ncbi:Nitrogenase component 1 type Oxidoreductase [Tindallia magadiensis]|uniref:Nitrogenase component 1 type Oxidoreductase n=1 Tax=Tindallia magadiensis TaxID=69895 RepID=A0A1I3GDT2_9FIRM|nr:nitrogenase component 1 [Tindallia magadiensis]SFI21564.1 Nitrogenase component 1 type Oxidoreductase [Tindallia magadiensis]
MKTILTKLPPLAPDYSGASAAFYSLGGVIILNGADGCIGNVTGYDEPRFFEEPSHIFSSGLREIHAITGDEEVLLEKIRKAQIRENIQFIVILGTPTSAVIASDHESISKMVMAEKSIPVIPLNTTGIETYEKGSALAFETIAKNWASSEQPAQGAVNILGATPMDYWSLNQIMEIKEALESHGQRVNSIWGMDGQGLDSIKRSLNAQVNLVISISGLKAAKYLKQKYDMPYVVGVPVGKESTKALVDQLKNPSAPVERREEKNSIPPAGLIIGEQVWANAFRDYLEKEKAMSSLQVCSLFQMEKAYCREGDKQIDSEEELEMMAETHSYPVVVGDPFFQSIFTSDKTNFYSAPHLAVSSRISWGHDVLYTGLSPTVIADRKRNLG